MLLSRCRRGNFSAKVDGRQAARRNIFIPQAWQQTGIDPENQREFLLHENHDNLGTGPEII